MTRPNPKRLQDEMSSAARTAFLVADEVAEALESGRPVTALESAVITHGLPRPLNHEVALECEAAVRSAGGVPATVAVLDGKVRVGLAPQELSRLAADDAATKCGYHSLALAVARRNSGGTTVAATAWIASRVGIPVFATGGIGGVHRGRNIDVSGDLAVLARTPVAVVCSGAKSLLDLPATLEVLETLGVLVLGLGTGDLPAFYSASSGLAVDATVASVGEAAAVVKAHDRLTVDSAVLLAVPVPSGFEVPSDMLEPAMVRALDEAERDVGAGHEVTPYVLRRLAELTDGRTLAANRALLTNNARVGAELAAALAFDSLT